MDWTGVIIAGLAATAAITILMYAGPMMGMPKMDIGQMLGSMVHSQGGLALTMGLMVHFGMGIVFAIIYALVWQGLDLAPSWWTGLVFGAVHFVVATAGMSMMPVIHKEVRLQRLSSPLAAGPKGIMGMLVGHLVFGLVVALVYRPFVI